MHLVVHGFIWYPQSLPRSLYFGPLYCTHWNFQPILSTQMVFPSDWLDNLSSLCQSICPTLELWTYFLCLLNSRSSNSAASKPDQGILCTLHFFLVIRDSRPCCILWLLQVVRHFCCGIFSESLPLLQVEGYQVLLNQLHLYCLCQSFQRQNQFLSKFCELLISFLCWLTLSSFAMTLFIETGKGSSIF